MFASDEVHGWSRRHILGSAAAAMAYAACPAPALAQSRRAELILTQGRIHTFDPARPIVDSIAIAKGRVLAIGSADEVAAYMGDATRTLRLGGRTVIPGLNDSHMHPSRQGRFHALELRWDGVRTLARAMDMLAEQAVRTPKGHWVRVIGGFSPFQFEERRMPTIAELNAIAPDTPVVVTLLYSQALLNRAAVAARGLTSATPTPPGTRYEFTRDGGAIIHAEPNPDLVYAAIGALPALDPAAQQLSTRHFYRELNRFGLTSVIDAGGGGHRFPDDYGATQSLAVEGATGIRLSTYLFPQNKGAELAEFMRWTENYEAGQQFGPLEHGLEIEGGGEFLTWSAGDFENFLAARPELDQRPRWRSDLLAVVRHLMARRWPLRIHATYDQSISQILDVFADADRAERDGGRQGLAGIRWAIDHAETVSDVNLARIKRMGGGLAFQSRMAFAGEYFLERYGRAATDRAPPLKTALQVGLPVGLGSDATRVGTYNPWVTLQWAVTGRSIGGTPLHGPCQHLSRQEALFAHTAGSAWFSQEEHEKGRLSPGFLADLAVLDRPFFDVASEDIAKIESLLTLVGGTPVWAAGAFADMIAPLPAVEPPWSPLNHFRTYTS